MKNIQLINDSFQNWKKYLTCKAQLIIADPPYNLGVNAYASNPSWYVDGDNKKGESDKAGRAFFDTDNDFRPAENTRLLDTRDSCFKIKCLPARTTLFGKKHSLKTVITDIYCFR